MCSRLTLLIFCALALILRSDAAEDPFAAGVRATEPLTPAEQLKRFRVPTGFEIQLVATEPDINKPLNLAFDARGRLWVTTSIEYPFAAPTNRPARDRLMIFEDFGPDGRARKVTQFADGLNVPIGVFPYRDGAVVWSIPNLWFFRDTDGDGRADAREILYGPFDHTRDTHGNLASFRRGFDGWLYGTHGYNNDSRVRGRDGHEVHMNSGNTYRLRLDGERIEHFTWGQVNPFGAAFDPLGNLYTSDCHSAPIYQLLPGGYYPSFGKPHDGLGFAPVLMEHAHGSTAIDGLSYCSDDSWPEEYRDNIFIGNVMTSRVNRDRLTFSGSSPTANELADFVTTDDPWFRPVDTCLGPDGALYIADFYNRIIGHYEVPLMHPGRDRERGRIWRVVHRGAPSGPGGEFLSGVSLPKTLEGLMAEYASPNLTRRMLAMNEVVENFATSAVAPARQLLTVSTSSPWPKVHALWTLERLSALTDDQLRIAAQDPAAAVRVHVMRILASRGRRDQASATSIPNFGASTGFELDLARHGLGDRNALTQRAAAEALGYRPHFGNLRPLLSLREQASAADTHLLYGVRQSIRNQLTSENVLREVQRQSWNDADLTALLDVAPAVKSPTAGSFIVQHLNRLGTNPPLLASTLEHAARYAPEADVPKIAQFARNHFSGDLGLRLSLFNWIQSGLEQRGAAIPSEVQKWGSEIAHQALDSLDAKSVAWTSRSLDERLDSAPWKWEERRCADGQTSRMLSSLPGGEQSTGILRSPSFPLPARFSFWLCGHDGFPDKPAKALNAIRLRKAGTGEILAERPAPRNDTAQRIEWNLPDRQGEIVFLEATDGDSGTAFAWLAFGRFEPQALDWPSLTPSELVDRETAVASLTGKLNLPALAPQMEAWLKSEDTVSPVRLASARAFLKLDRDKAVKTIDPILKDGSNPAALREELGVLLAALKAPESDRTVVEAMKYAPYRQQLRWSYELAQNPGGAEAVLGAVATGAASPRLLQTVGMKNRFQASRPLNWEERVKRLTENLPPADEARDRLILERRAGFATASTTLGEGARVYQQSCAPCHQLDGVGALVGPQLAGIGDRGLDRLCEDLLDPNRNVDHAFRQSLFTLKDGESIAGLFRREEGELLVLADATGKELTVKKGDVLERRELDTSLMPDNLGEAISVSDFNHLLAFLLSKRGAK